MEATETVAKTRVQMKILKKSELIRLSVKILL